MKYSNFLNFKYFLTIISFCFVIQENHILYLFPWVIFFMSKLRHLSFFEFIYSLNPLPFLCIRNHNTDCLHVKLRVSSSSSPQLLRCRRIKLRTVKPPGAFKGTKDWDFFLLRFWNLYYFFISYVKILRFYKKIFLIRPLLGEIRFFRLVWD
jgi:hypothetical protein